MSKKILLLNQTFYPDHAATAQQLTDLALALTKRQFEVDVLCDARSWDDRSTSYPRFERYQGINIMRVPSSSFGKKTRFHRAVDYLSFNFSLLFRLFHLRKYDHIVSLTSPPWISFFGALFKSYRPSRLINWSMDVNPDEAVELGWLKKNGVLHNIFERLSKYSYRKSDWIIALDRYMADRISSKGGYDGKVAVVPPWSLSDDIQPVAHDKNTFRKINKLDDKFVVMYSGNFSVCHPIETLLKTAKLMKDNKRLIFVFVGGGVRKKEIVDFKDRHSLENIVVLPYQERKDLKYSLSAADLHVVIMGEKYVGIIHPCKIYGILSTGRPFVLIGPSKSHVGDIIQETGHGFQVDHGEIENLRSTINRAMVLSPSEKEDIWKKNRSLVDKKFSRNYLTDKFINFFLS